MRGEVYSVRLVVQEQESGFVGKWIDDDGQESSSFPLVLPMDEDDAAELRWYREVVDYLSSAEIRSSRLEGEGVMGTGICRWARRELKSKLR